MSDDIDTSYDLEAPPPRSDVAKTGSSTIGPGWLSGVLIVLATVLAIFATLTTWVRSQALDTDQWVEVSENLLADEEVRDALSLYLADQLFSTVDVSDVLEERLPENLSGLAGPLAGALRGPTTDGIEKLVSSDQFRAAWVTANRAAHEVLVAVLRGNSTDNVSTAGGAVVLDLGNAVTQVGENIGVPQAALDRIPADAGQVTIFTSSQLDDAQNAVRILDFTSWFLFLVVVLLYVAAVYVAVGRRRVALRSVGLSLIVAGLLVLMLRSVGVRTAVDAVVKDPTKDDLANAVAAIATELLDQLAWTGVIYGLLIVAFAVLLGDHRWAVSIRRSIAGFADSTAMIVAIATVVVLILFWWSPGDAFDRWVTGLTLVGLAIGAVVALVVTGRRELPVDSSSAPQAVSQAETSE